MTLEERHIAFIGGGHITEILIHNFIKKQTLHPEQVIVSDPIKKRLDILADRFAVSTTTNNTVAVSKGEFIFINVLPQVVPHVTSELKADGLLEGKLIITLAAGVSIERYHTLGDNVPVVRILPNPPSQIGQGVIAIAYNEFVSAAQKEDVDKLFHSLGLCIVLEERHINAVTAMTTPATIFMFFQSLIDAGVRAGIDRDTCTKIAYQTIVGSMEVWHQRKVSPSELMAEASTPGGISVECLHVLEKSAFRAAISDAISKGAERAAQFC